MILGLVLSFSIYAINPYIDFRKLTVKGDLNHPNYIQMMDILSLMMILTIMARQSDIQ